jgi:hypothetical protein
MDEEIISRQEITMQNERVKAPKHCSREIPNKNTFYTI